jgi:uncharacterized membrane protein YkoI
MSLYRTFALAALCAGLLATPALAGGPRVGGMDRSRMQQQQQQQSRPEMNYQRRDADRAFDATREGRAMPLPKIERRVRPFMGGADYLGPELNGDRYRLKFVKDGRVIWVDVDAATGRIVGRSRP